MTPPEMWEAPMWDDRYSADGYIFGTAPAAFLVRFAEYLTPGARALVVADGEGRNSVFVAEQGLDVTATDISTVALEKARRLAADHDVTVDFRVADLLTWKWEPDAYDVVVAVFIQFLNPQQRNEVFAGLTRTLRPGGHLLLHGYSVDQLQYRTGGPSIPEHLYTDALLAQAFPDFEIKELASYVADIDEGSGHSGPSALTDLVARKR